MTPKIVSTPNTLSGTPRIDSHRIGVCHILANARKDIVAATKVNFPQLEEAEVNAAIDYAIERCESAPSREAVRELERERDEFKEAAYRLENTIRLLRAESAPSAQTPTALAHSSFLSNGICRCACNPHCGCECHKLTNSTPEAEPVQTPRWISVKERMPAEKENGWRWVMVYDKAWDSIYFAVWLEDEWEPCEERETQPREITHWQPLPSAPEAEVKTEWSTCPKCHQSVNGPHECYESVLNQPEECTCAFLNIGCSLHDKPNENAPLEVRAEVKIDRAGSNPAPVGAAGDADSVNRSRAYNSQAQTSAAPLPDRCPGCGSTLKFNWREQNEHLCRNRWHGHDQTEKEKP